MKYLIAIVVSGIVCVLLRQTGLDEFLTGWFSCTAFWAVKDACRYIKINFNK